VCLALPVKIWGEAKDRGGGSTMLWTIFAILLIMWLLGYGLHFGGGLIHLLLVVGVVVLLWNLITGRRSSA